MVVPKGLMTRRHAYPLIWAPSTSRLKWPCTSKIINYCKKCQVFEEILLTYQYVTRTCGIGCLPPIWLYELYIWLNVTAELLATMLILQVLQY